MNIAIVPARIGSKRIKKKNIKKFLGKPIILYVIETLKKTKIFKKIFVSTDSIEVAEIVTKIPHVEVLFRENKYLSGDGSTTMELINSVYKKINTKEFNIKYIFTIYSTAVFVKKNHILSAFNILKKKNANMLFACKKFTHPIDRAFTINKNGFANFLNKKVLHKKTQYFRNYYFDLGQFYIFKSSLLKKNKRIITNGLPYFFKSHEAFDIDNIDDWKLAEEIYKIK